jgi:hypothetical protein
MSAEYGEKYGPVSYHLHRSARGALRGALRAVAPRFDGRKPSASGYTPIIGVRHDLLGILESNLMLLSQQDLDSLAETIVVVDTVPDTVLEHRLATMAQKFPELRMRTLFYSPAQRSVAGAMDLPWVYCWLSWAIGLASAESDTVVLHDLDAMLLDAGTLERRYATFRSEQLKYFGDRYYSGQGVTTSDRLVVTWELFMDLAHLRSEHTSMDLLSSIGRLGARRVDFDITLRAQLETEARQASEIPRDSFVHPSQVIHQYTQLRSAKPVYDIPAPWTVFFVPYFQSLSQGESVLTQACADLGSTDDQPGQPFLGGRIRLQGRPEDNVGWMEEQVSRLETRMFGQVRPAVAEYLDVLRRASGDGVLGR